MRPFITVFIVFLLVLLAILFINTVRFKSKQLQAPGQHSREFAIDDSAVAHLSRAISLPTISQELNAGIDSVAFDGIISFLDSTYPLVLQKLERTLINRNSLLYRWKGREGKELPVILYAHLDVVPADSALTGKWIHPPFSGLVSDGSIWGRGAIDDKSSVISIFEAIQQLLKNNFQPARDIYFAFGQDEETGGQSGAYEIARHLEQNQIKAEFLLDEGGLVSEGMVPFVDHPVALVGTAEKGFLTLEFHVKGDGGHSSMPAPETPIDILSRALVRLNEHPFPSRATQPLIDFMKYVGPEMNMPYKTLFANQWLFRRIIFHEYEKLKGGNAMIRTTGVATIFHSGSKENVIPSESSAKVNFRILPGESNQTVIKRVKEVIQDERVTVSITGDHSEPSRVSSINTHGFKLIQKTIHEVFPDAVIAPQLLIGGTDSKHFSRVAENTFRFIPVRMKQEDLDGMHGSNEKIRISSLMESIAFYRSLIKGL